MDHRETIVISDSSDDCEIDESRSAPKRPPTFNPRQHQMDQPMSRIRLPLNRYPGPLPHPDQMHDLSPFHVRPQAPTRRMPSPPKRPKASPAGVAARPSSSVAKSSSSKKNPSNRSVDARGGRRCTVCIQDGRSCDGGNPCASCFDPGFICVYPGEKPAFIQQHISVVESERVRSLQDISLSLSHREEKKVRGYQSKKNTFNQVPSATPPEHWSTILSASDVAKVARDANKDVNVVQSSGNAKMLDNHNSTTQHQDPKDIKAPIISNGNHEHEKLGEVGCDTSHDDSVAAIRVQEPASLEIEQIPDTLWLPNSLEEVQKLILMHEANIKSHREYIVEAQLAGAKVKTQQNIHIDPVKRGVNPFKKLIGDVAGNPNAKGMPAMLDVKIKPRRGDFTNLKVPVGFLGEDKVAHIPEYKSIGRLRSTFLARNVHGLKYVPYHAGIEEKDLSQRKHDLETHFKDHSIEEFRRQRECLEMVYQWSDDFDEILNELKISVPQLWKWMSQSTLAKCQKCQTSCGKTPLSISAEVDISRDEKQRCHWLYEAFTKITKIGIWHFVLPRPGQVEKHRSTLADRSKHSFKEEHALCALCFTHNCMTHGSYVDKGMTDDAGEAIINDSEEQNNERRRTVLRVGTRNLPLHACGLYCLGSEFPSLHDAHKILGVDENDELTGLRNEEIKMITDLGPFHGKKPCDNHCFINREDRPLRPSVTLGSFKDVSKTTQQLIQSMAKLYGSHVRLPCMVGKVANMGCMTAFFLLLQVYKDGHSNMTNEENADTVGALDPRKIPIKTGGYNIARSASLENRKTWAPCSHNGPCLSSNSDCSCAREQVNCEKSCACSDSCRRRFRGCKCKKKCFLDDRCECYVANRECDPQLCHDCGVEEVLDPSNKYREDVREGRCRNNRLQLDLPPRTVKGMSEVQGWGLFLGEDLPSNSFVGEYKGENISASESDRRGAIYAYVSQEYLFNLNRDHQLDGSRFGNKTRFINNSKAKEFINVFPKVMFVNGVTRIGLFTNRAMKAGEELLYDYGYPADLVKGEFWEKHERAIEHNGVVTPIAKPKFRPRMAKNAVDTPGNEDGEETPVRKVVQPGRKKKRKRRVDGEIEDSDGGIESTVHIPEPIMMNNAESDSSEYEESSQANDVSSPGSGAVEESEDELSMPAKPIDRRRGGEAQRRAAQTRRLNKLRGKG